MLHLSPTFPLRAENSDHIVHTFLSVLTLYSSVVTMCTTRFNIHKFYVQHAQCICVLCGSENKQRLFPYTALTDWFL